MLKKRDLKRDLGKYAIIVLIFTGLIGFLIIFRGGGGFTGYAIFEDNEQTEFNLGTYANTTYNGSAIVLSGSNLSGSYTSKVFDTGNVSVWNNLSKTQNTPSIEFLFATDNQADVWKSIDLGVSWSLVKDDYNNGDNNGGTDIVKNSSGSLFILFNQDIWKSDDKGFTWTKVNDNYNGAEGQNGYVLGIDNNNNLIIIEGDQDVWKSSDLGIAFTKVSTDFNGGNGNIFGIAVNSLNVIFVVDGAADVWKSVDSGSTWTLVKDDYNGANGNNANDMIIDSNNNLYILDVQDVFKSTDSGVTWTKINDDFNGAGDSQSGIVIGIDSNNNVYVIDGGEDIFKSGDGGVSFTKIATDFNGANGGIFGLISLISSTNLSFQARSCDDASCSGESWVAVDNPLSLGLSNNRYFQYKIDFTSPDSSVTPSLTNMSIDYTLVNTAPTLNLVSPQNGASYGYNESLALDFSVSDVDNNLQFCWYNINSGTNIILASCVNITFNVAGNGEYTLNIFANDSLGLETSDSATFNVAVGSPSIVLNSPIDFYFNNGNNIQFSYTPIDIDLNYCELWANFDGQFKLNQTDNSPVSGSENNFVISSLGDGTYLWNIRCVDDVGHSAFNGNKSFYVDSVNPTLSLSEPTGAKTSRTISASWSVTDNSPVSCRYNVYRGGSLEIQNISVNCSANSASFSVTIDADFVFNFYVNDSAGNSNSASSSFSVDTSTPVSSPSGGSSGSSSGGGGGGGGGRYIPTNTTKISKLELSNVGNIVAHSGDKKTISLNVKNIGTSFLNKCRLISSEDINPWIYSIQVEGIAPGESIDFNFDLNVPDELSSGDYSGELQINCQEASDKQAVVISIPGLDMINIKNITNEKNKLKITYDFDSSKIIGKNASVNIWIIDGNGIEINTIQDIFSITGRLIERNIEVEVSGENEGVYYVYFALSSDLGSYLRQSVVLGKTSTTGFAVFDTARGKTIIYIIFLVIIAIGIFFIWRRHGKIKHPTSRWLFRKRESK